MVEIIMIEIALIAETVPTTETVLTAETVTPTLTTAEHRLHSPIEIATHQLETILKDNPEAITLNIIERTQVKTTNVPQTAIHQATTPTEVVEEVCLAAVAAIERPAAAAEECPVVAEVEDDNIILKIN
jgi:hypothetical protein